MNFCSYCPALLWRSVHLVIFCSMRPLVASGKKPKAFCFLNEFMPFKFGYNSNSDNIFVKNLNLVFQPIWQPYCSTFKYLAGACCSSCNALQRPSTFPSSTCIDILRGDFMYVIHGGHFIYVQQQHVVDVLAVASLSTCSAAAAAAADLLRQDQTVVIKSKCTLFTLLLLVLRRTINES